MINLDTSHITLEEFNQLPSRQKHAYTEERMDGRIAISYRQAIDEFRTAIDSHEVLKNAYKNFNLMKKKKIHQFPAEDLLLCAYADKFTKRLYFVIKDRNYNFSHYLYDISSKQLLNFAENYYPLNKLPDTFPKFTYIAFCSSYNGILEEIWRNATIVHTLQNEDVPEVLNQSPNQKYLGDDKYSSLTKHFSIINDYEEKNNFCGMTFNNHFNPGHTILDPKDLDEFEKKNVKSARAF